MKKILAVGLVIMLMLAAYGVAGLGAPQRGVTENSVANDTTTTTSVTNTPTTTSSETTDDDDTTTTTTTATTTQTTTTQTTTTPSSTTRTTDEDDDTDDEGNTDTATRVTSTQTAPSSTSSPAQARFMVGVATLNDTVIESGEAVKVALRVENTGGQAGEFETQLVVDGETVASRSVTIGAGETEVIEFERQFEQPGRYRIGIGSTQLGTVFVSSASETATPPTNDQLSPMEIVEADIPADWVSGGSQTELRVTVANTENRTVTRTLTVTIDGEPVADETVTLEAEERRTVTIRFEAASGTVAVEGVEAGRIEIRNTADGPGTTTGEPGIETRVFVGFAVLATAVVVALVGVVVMTRRYD